MEWELGVIEYRQDFRADELDRLMTPYPSFTVINQAGPAQSTTEL